MKRRKAAKRKPGKYAGRSLFVTGPATEANPGNVQAALAKAETAAIAVLTEAGYDESEGRHWATAILAEPAQSAVHRAARKMMCIRDCRSAIARQDAESAAWAAYVLAEIIGRNNLDGFAESIHRDVGRQKGTARGGRTKRQSATERWQNLALAAVRAVGQGCTAKAAWRWAIAHGKGIRTDGAAAMYCEESDAYLAETSWPRYVTRAHRTISSTE